MEHMVRFVDDHHVYVDGRQFVSLTRFFDNRAEIAQEQKALSEEVDRLRAETEHLKALLKETL